ncbi:hypothetical protein PBI_COUNT_65 [Microbacterium phage Count]|nr:hypothetical protein PBI_COUNT_65 [Microbacterium phage Count]
MATAARKARKRAGIKFEKKAKTPTPPHERSYVTQPVQGPGGTKFENYTQPRSEKKRQRFLDQFTPAPSE